MFIFQHSSRLKCCGRAEKQQQSDKKYQKNHFDCFITIKDCNFFICIGILMVFDPIRFFGAQPSKPNSFDVSSGRNTSKRDTQAFPSFRLNGQEDAAKLLFPATQSGPADVQLANYIPQNREPQQEIPKSPTILGDRITSDIHRQDAQKNRELVKTVLQEADLNGNGDGETTILELSQYTDQLTDTYRITQDSETLRELGAGLELKRSFEEFPTAESIDQASDEAIQEHFSDSLDYGQTYMAFFEQALAKDQVAQQNLPKKRAMIKQIIQTADQNSDLTASKQELQDYVNDLVFAYQLNPSQETILQIGMTMMLLRLYQSPLKITNASDVDSLSDMDIKSSFDEDKNSYRGQEYLHSLNSIENV